MKRKLLILVAVLIAFTSGITLLTRTFADDANPFTTEHRERKLRNDFRQKIETLFPKQAAAARARYGIYIYTSTDAAPIRADAAPPTDRMILLVHGLDDPARVWITLRPTLLKKGYTVAQFEYPNDQSIADSTALMAEKITILKQRGVQRLDIVAHSMGGLICRDLLTDPKYKSDDRPATHRLIMVATPHHGSPMVGLRGFAEIRDQFTRALAGQHNTAHLLDGIFDGCGEAAIDLKPDSEFLTTLNARPNPKNVKFTLIAGRMTPPLNNALEKPAESLGDGCVSLASSKLEGATDYTVVEATHLSIIRNITESSDRVPPAVPIILDRLKSDAP